MATSILQDAIAGPYIAHYGYLRSTGLTSEPTVDTAHKLGLIGERGIRQITRTEREDITCDLLGAAVIESVYLSGQMFLEFELEEANLDMVRALSNPHSIDPTDPQEYQLGIPGTLDAAGVSVTKGAAGWLKLTPVTNTPAGAVTTPVRDYPLVLLASGFDLERVLSVRRRVIPVRLRVYPYYDSGNDEFIWFQTSALP